MTKATKCVTCEQQFSAVDGCETPDVVLGRTVYARIPYGDAREQWPSDEMAPPDQCHGCGVTFGQRHHTDCDIERCPQCRGQLLSCGCAA